MSVAVASAFMHIFQHVHLLATNQPIMQSPTHPINQNRKRKKGKRTIVSTESMMAYRIGDNENTFPPPCG
jgi:hypothetical protein